MRRLDSLWMLSVAVFALAGTTALAGSGTWITNSDGNWSDTGNWSGGTVAGGTDATANFSGLNITANRTVTVDAGRTVGHLSFGDTTKTSYGQWWILAGDTLTLDTSAGSPTIETDVDGKGSGFARISVALAGSDGVIFNNALVRLDVTSSYSGGTTINGGSVRLNANNALGTDTITFNGGVMCAYGLNTTKTLDNDVIFANDLTFGYNGSSCSGTVKFTAVATITGNRTLRQEGYTTNFAGGISDSGNGYSLTIDLDPTPYSKQKFMLGGSTAYSGPTFINGTTLQITGSMNTTTPYVEVNRGNYGSGTLNAYSDGDNDRIADDLPIYLQGGGLSLSGPNNKSPVETLGTVTVRPSASRVQASPYRGVTRFTIADLVRDRGTVYFYAGTTGSHTGPLGGTSGWRGHIFLTGQAEGYMGGWATAALLSNSGYRDLATYSAARGVEILGTSVARPGQVDGAPAGSHVLTTGAQGVLAGNASIASLVVQGGGNNGLGGFTLDLTGGGLLATTAYTISNGNLTSSADELYLTALNGMTVDANLIGGMDVITTGTMAFGGTNTLAGELCVNSGTLSLTGVNLFNIIITLAPGGTLDLQRSDAVTDGTVVNLLHSNPFGMLNLGADVTIEALNLDGDWQPAGDYTANDLPDWVSGPGTLHVLFDGPQGVVIPEPGSAVMLLLGAAGLVRKRRRA